MIQRIRFNNIANPGANGVAVIFDDSAVDSTEATNRGRVTFTLFSDQGVTINTYWAESPTASLRLVESNIIDAWLVALHSTQQITCVAKANLVDNDYFTVVYTSIVDGVTTTLTKIFEYKVTGGFVATVGRIAIDVTGATTATSVAVLTAAAINTAFTAITVPVPTTATLTAGANQSGARFTISATENVTDAGFAIGTKTTGQEGIYDKTVRLRPGVNRVTAVTTTAPVEWGCAVETTSSVVKDS
jgi:hypothetical protein